MSTNIERFVIRHTAGSKINQVEEFDFNKSELTIGRASGCDIQYDPEQEVIVSREHGKIVKLSDDPPKFEIRDNNSRNGIFVNKNRVKSSVGLEVGDEVQLGLNGPVFSFDIYPRPQDLMAATRMVEIPTSIKPTTISEVQAVEVMPNSEPVKVGLGKQTVERMLVGERKKAGNKMAIVLVSLIAVLGILGYVFREKIFGDTVIVNPKPTADDSLARRKRTPEQINKENEDKVVKIEFGWQLFDANTSDELWHQYMPVKGQDGQIQWQAMYIQNQDGGIEPYLDLKTKVYPNGEPMGMAGASGTGFVVSQDGLILTNRHVAASWNTRHNFKDYAFPGILVQNANGKIIPVKDAPPVTLGNVATYVPANATMIGGQTINQGQIKGRNSYIKVIFANTVLRRDVISVTPSEEHDVALIKVEGLGQNLSPVKMLDKYGSVAPGQAVTVMGYPGVAPEETVFRKSNDPFNRQTQQTTIPTPTVTSGNIGRIILPSSEKNHTYSGFGDSYQLTINATGAGNSGGPMFDDEGNVIGIYYAGKSDERGTQISFAVPIKYGIELMSITKVQ
ncbi:MAG: trypsin-like peptidase domain-containing protein [Ferruginibacter sp.]